MTGGREAGFRAVRGGKGPGPVRFSAQVTGPLDLDDRGHNSTRSRVSDLFWGESKRISVWALPWRKEGKDGVKPLWLFHSYSSGCVPLTTHCMGFVQGAEWKPDALDKYSLEIFIKHISCLWEFSKPSIYLNALWLSNRKNWAEFQTFLTTEFCSTHCGKRCSKPQSKECRRHPLL